MKSNMNRDLSMVWRELRNPIRIFFAGYIISYIQYIPSIHDTLIGDTMMAIFGKGDQLFLVLYTFLVVEVLNALYKHKPKNIAILGLLFYAIILVLYRYMPSLGNGSTTFELISRTTFYALLGWFFRMLK